MTSIITTTGRRSRSRRKMTRTNMWSDASVRGSHGLSAGRAQRKKLRCPKGKKPARSRGPTGP